MTAPTIPYGPGASILNLSATDFEHLATDGPAETLVNQKISTKKDGTFLRVIATQSRLAYTENYALLSVDPTIPALGKHTVTPVVGDAFSVWMNSINRSNPQEADQTMAFGFWMPDDVAAPEALRADVLVAAIPDLGAGFGGSIPFGPGAEPLGLAAASFEFVSVDGPNQAPENEKTSNTKDGLILRVVATGGKLTWTANYQILNGATALPRCGLYDASAGAIGQSVWLESVTPSAPQDADRTLACTFSLWIDIANTEALYSAFGLRGV